jgi:hypothetical protein
MIPTVPPILSLFPLFNDEGAMLDFLMTKNCFDIPSSCEACGSTLSLRRDQQIWRCTKHTCRKQVSLRKGSFFSRNRLSLSKTLILGYAWLLKMPQTSIIPFAQCSPNTAAAYSKFFRQLVADSLDFEDFVIGGEGVTIEVDECKLGKRKHNRGHHVEGVWVLGGVERTEERRVFLLPVPDRTAETLMDVLARHILPGTIVLTDLWRGYLAMSEVLGVEHRTVNHSVGFVNLVDGTCTNTIEGTWNGVKLSIAPRKRTNDLIEECLWEFIWRRKCKEDLWGGLLEAMSIVSFD